MTITMKRTDLAIIGAGPAGIAAAIEAGAGGASVILVDAYAQPGGHYFEHLPAAFQRTVSDKDDRRSELRALMASLSCESGVEVLTGTTVWGVFQAEGPSFANRVNVVNVGTSRNAPTGSLRLRSGQVSNPAEGGGLPNPPGAFRELLSVQSERPRKDRGHREGFFLCLQGAHQMRCVKAKFLILATGAYDRPVPFPGWTLPGVITPGAAQMLLRGQGILPGRRILVAGSGPLLLAVGASLAEEGAQVVGVLDTASLGDGWRAMPQALWGQWARLREGWSHWRTLRIHRVPVLFGHAIFRAIGEQEVRAAVVGKVDAAGHPLWDTGRTIAVDTICVGFGFLPSTALSRHLGCNHIYDPGLGAYVPWHEETMETDVPGVFVAGDIAGVGGKELAMLQGQIAGLTILGKLGYLAPEAVKARIRGLDSRIDREKRFARMLTERFRVRPGLLELISDDTVICRCEKVTAGQIKEAAADGAQDVHGVKIRTRVGMGSCQGRYCNRVVGDLVARETGRAREEVGAMTVRPPVMPILANDLLGESSSPPKAGENR